MPLIRLLVFIGCTLVAAAMAQAPPDVFARYGIHADPVDATLRNDGPHTITGVTWIWTTTASDGRRIPVGVHQTSGSSNKPPNVTGPATLDAVVLNNEIILGPDEWGVLEFRRAAEAAIAELSAKLNDAALTDSQLETWLAEQVLNRRPTLKPNGFPDHAKGALGTLAENVRHQIKRDGHPKVAALLAEVTKKNAAAKPAVAVKE